MPIRAAQEVRDRCEGDLSCPRCGVRFAPTGHGQPVLVDDQGRPYCGRHARSESVVFRELPEDYRRLRISVASAVDSGLLSPAECTAVYDGFRAGLDNLDDGED